ncbi:MAG: glycine zipper 2TM domain-containing protein [Aquabacterium sp.]|uniref:glycine zipper 2TM domain-containing protein n=1 Tax=Aquabacterium sp. TaxID=1872578 RepID=UPI0025BFC229|nr:glycine zipper 2TM domain-containing protein [Aquabacterium sp.]MBI3382198.1 glycine zipper 2TM domain-containing protein [Aquabacterium sp.]
MSEEAKPSNAVTVQVPRTALFAGGGIALVGLGLAAGMMLRSPSAPAPDAQQATQQAMVQASGPEAATEAQGKAPVDKEAATHASTSSHKREARHQADNAGTEQTAQPMSPELSGRPAVACANCGVIEAVRAVQQKGQGSGVGAVAGGVLGGVVGNQMGKGSGKTAMTVLGAIGGGFAGNEVEKQTRTVTVYEVRVRMDDGSVRTFTQNTEPAPGTRVEVNGHSFRAIEAGADSGRPATIQTSGSGGV